MKRTTEIIIALALALLAPTAAHAGSEQPRSTKLERNLVREGNKLYNQKKWSEAEVQYRKALQANPSSAMAQFNLASALLRQDSQAAPAGKQQGKQQKQDPMSEATSLLQNLAKTCNDPMIAGRAAYDLGNLSYKQEQYDQAIECYKQALRCDPDDNNARYNLRMAQLKKQQQQKNKGGGGGGKNNKNDKNKQNQNKQNQDKQNGQQQPSKPQQSQPQQQSGMSQQNQEQILRTVQDQENATQQRINAERARQQEAERARTQNKW